MTITFGDNNPLPVEDGSIQLDSANEGSLKFQFLGLNPNYIGEIDSELDQTNGGKLEFYTKENDGLLTKKMSIKHDGSVGILTENGIFSINNNSGSQQSLIYNSQFADKDLTITSYSSETAKGIRFLTNTTQRMRINFNGALGFGSTGSVGNPGQHLKSNGSTNPPSWTNELNANSISTTSNNNLIIQTNPTTQAVEFRTSQIYPQTNNTTRLGGAGNRWLEGYFDITDTNLIKTQGVYNTNGNIDIGPLNYAYPRFRIGGPNGWNEAYLSNTMNSGYYFRIAGHPAYQGAMHFNANGNITCNTSFTPASDDRLKHNETTITKALHLIRQLVPKKYEKTETMLPADYKGTLPKGMNYVIEAGFIAQEIKKIPELSFAVNGGDYENEKEDGTKEIKAHPFNLNYDTIFTYVTAAVQELDTIVQKQAQLISSLEARIKTLESK